MIKRLLIFFLLSLFPAYAFADAAFIGSLIEQGVISGGGGTSCSGDYGYTTAGGSYSVGAAGKTFCARRSLGCDGSVSSMSLYAQYMDDTSKEVEFALYSDDGTGSDPDALLGNYGPFFDSGTSAASWTTDSTISETISGEPTYIWACVQTEGNTNIHYDGSVSGAQLRIYTGTWGTWETTWPTGSDTSHADLEASIYITF